MLPLHPGNSADTEKIVRDLPSEPWWITEGPTRHAEVVRRVRAGEWVALPVLGVVTLALSSYQNAGPGGVEGARLQKAWGDAIYALIRGGALPMDAQGYVDAGAVARVLPDLESETGLSAGALLRVWCSQSVQPVEGETVESVQPVDNRVEWVRRKVLERRASRYKSVLSWIERMEGQVDGSPFRLEDLRREKEGKKKSYTYHVPTCMKYFAWREINVGGGDDSGIADTTHNPRTALSNVLGMSPKSPRK